MYSIILNYLGNYKFLAMTGSVAMSNGKSLILKFKGSKVNVMEITPKYNELYKVTFAKQKGLQYNIVKELDDVYGETLKSIFEKETNLRTSL